MFSLGSSRSTTTQPSSLHKATPASSAQVIRTAAKRLYGSGPNPLPAPGTGRVPSESGPAIQAVEQGPYRSAKTAVQGANVLTHTLGTYLLASLSSIRPFHPPSRSQSEPCWLVSPSN